jgi:hypothetical protein
VPERTRVQLPVGVEGNFEVFVNGVAQQLAREGRLGFWRWLSLFLGVAGTYRQNDSVDVVYERDGRRVVATSLPLADEA